MRVQGWNRPLVVQDLLHTHANTYSNEFRLGSCSTGPQIETFGFDASLLQVLNESSSSIYVSLEGSTSVSTDDAEIQAGGKMEYSIDQLIGGASFYTVATSSNGQLVTIHAVGASSS